MNSRELIQATSAKINRLGALFYFDAATLAAGKELGLDGFRFYVLGRGGVLGDAPASVVSASFGYFSPSVMDRIWNSAREKVAPATAAQAYLDCNADLGRRGLVEVAGLDDFGDAAAAIVAAADPSGLPLFAGLLNNPVPEDGPGRAMHYAVMLREYRGSVHLCAVVANGLTSTKAHVINRPDDLELFGISDPPEITDDDRAALVAAEAMTDAMMMSAFGALSEAQGQALVAGTDAMFDALVSE